MLSYLHCKEALPFGNKQNGNSEDGYSPRSSCCRGKIKKVCWHVQPEAIRSKRPSLDAHGYHGLLSCCQGKSGVDRTPLIANFDPAGTEELHQSGMTPSAVLFLSALSEHTFYCVFTRSPTTAYSKAGKRDSLMMINVGSWYRLPFHHLLPTPAVTAPC